MLIWRTPCVELIAAGKNAPRPIRNTAGAFPIPKNTSDNGTHAVTGMLRNTWMVGSRTRSVTLDSPISRPRNIPRATPQPKPAKTRHVLAQAWSNQVPEYRPAASVEPVTRSYQTERTSDGGGKTFRRTKPISLKICQSRRIAAGNMAYCSTIDVRRHRSFGFTTADDCDPADFVSFNITTLTVRRATAPMP